MDVGRPPPFQPFDRRRAVRIYRGNLPHWRQDGATYAVTFRLADSLPASVRAGWEQESREWMARHGIAYRPDDPSWHTAFGRLPEADQETYRRLVSHRVQTGLDQGYGSCLLAEPRHRACLAEAFGFIHGEGRAWTGDWVAMPNHVHALLTPACGHALEDILHTVKRHTAREINRLAGRRGRLWQKETFDHLVRHERALARARAYIADNPRQARLRPGTWHHHVADWMNAWCPCPTPD